MRVVPPIAGPDSVYKGSRRDFDPENMGDFGPYLKKTRSPGPEISGPIGGGPQGPRFPGSMELRPTHEEWPWTGYQPKSMVALRDGQMVEDTTVVNRLAQVEEQNVQLVSQMCDNTLVTQRVR